MFTFANVTRRWPTPFTTSSRRGAVAQKSLSVLQMALAAELEQEQELEQELEREQALEPARELELEQEQEPATRIQNARLSVVPASMNRFGKRMPRLIKMPITIVSFTCCFRLVRRQKLFGRGSAHRTGQQSNVATPRTRRPTVRIKKGTASSNRDGNVKYIGIELKTYSNNSVYETNLKKCPNSTYFALHHDNMKTCVSPPPRVVHSGLCPTQPTHVKCCTTEEQGWSVTELLQQSSSRYS